MQNKKKLLEYIKSRDLLILATNGPTASTLYFGIDDEFNFYIVTSPTSEHAKNFVEDTKVACVIVDTNQKMFQTKNKIGAQLIGDIEQVKNRELKQSLQFWSHGNNEMTEVFYKNISEGIWENKVYRIKPQEIKWFNEELYGEEGVETFKF